jgi:hypothetical protein
MLILGHIGYALGATQIGEAAVRKAAGRRLDAAAKLLDYRWLVFSEFLGSLFIARTLFKMWRMRNRVVTVRAPRSPVLIQTPPTSPC